MLVQYSHCQQISVGKDRAKIRIIKKQRGESGGKRVTYHLVLCHWSNSCSDVACACARTKSSRISVYMHEYTCKFEKTSYNHLCSDLILSLFIQFSVRFDLRKSSSSNVKKYDLKKPVTIILSSSRANSKKPVTIICVLT